MNKSPIIPNWTQVQTLQIPEELVTFELGPVVLVEAVWVENKASQLATAVLCWTAETMINASAKMRAHATNSLLNRELDWSSRQLDIHQVSLKAGEPHTRSWTNSVFLCKLRRTLRFGWRPRVYKMHRIDMVRMRVWPPPQLWRKPQSSVNRWWKNGNRKRRLRCQNDTSGRTVGRSEW